MKMKPNVDDCMWRFPSRYADPGPLSILSRITPHLIDDADRAVLGDTLAHMAAKPTRSLMRLKRAAHGVSLGHKYYGRPRPSRRAGLLATSNGPRYWSTFAKQIDCQVDRPSERSLSTQIS